MDLFEIVGKISLDGVDKAGQELNGLGDIGKKVSDKMSKFGGVMKGIGKGVLAVAGATGAGAVALVKSVQSSYGELQQNLGGSEAVFGEYASSIQEKAKDAYKNMGMSQAEYLATANKMGSLFQGSGIQQQEALDMTAKAMQRASDVASVMGLDMQMAMESITGAAKGNFTMMDNLGVAMNATTIEAYAHSKGIENFTWKTASQAEKNSIAMQMFLERTEQYAGNFARESTDTISGSIGFLGAAWKDFMAGLGDPMADMARLTNNLAQSFGAMIKNITPIIENIAKALPTVLTSLINSVSELAPSLIETFTTLIAQVVDGLVQMLPTIIPLIVDMVIKVVEALGQNLPVMIDALVTLVVQLMNGIVSMLPTLVPLILNAVLQLIMSLLEFLPTIIDTIVQALPVIIDAICNFLISATPQIIQGAIQMLMGIIQALPTIITALIQSLPTIISTIVTVLLENIPLIIEGAIQLFMGIILAIPQITVEIIKSIPQIIAGIVSGLISGIPQLIKTGGDLLAGLFKGLLNPKAIWNAVKGLFDGIVGGIKSIFGINSPSRVMADEVGKYLMEGVGVGMDEDDSAEKAMKSKVDNIIGIAEDASANLNIGTSVDNIVADSPMKKYQLDFNAQLGALGDGFDRLVSLVGQYLPDIAVNSAKELTFSGDKLVLGISKRMDLQLGKMAVAKGRGNV